MSKRSRIIFALVVGGLLTLVAARVFLGSGRSLEEIFAGLSQEDPAARARAAQELPAAWRGLLAADLAELEGSALPFLETTLREGETEARRYAATGLYLVAAGHPQAETVQQAVLGTLVAAAADEDALVRQNVALALASYRPQPPAAARAALLGLLGDADETTRGTAIQAMSRLRPVTGEVKAAVLAALEGAGSAQLRSAAAAGLGELGVVDDAVVAALLVALDDSAVAVRSQAVSALGRLAPPAPDVAIALDRVRRTDDHEMLRSTAAAALRGLRRGHEVPERVWADLASPEVDGRRRAADELSLYQIDDLSATLPALRPLLADADAEVRRHAATALYQAAYLNDGNRQALTEVMPELITLAEDGDVEVRWAALRGLALVPPAPPRSVVQPAALRLLEDEEAKVREMAAVVLGKARPVDPAVVEALLGILRRRPQAEADVGQSLARLARAHPGVGDLLTEWLTDASAAVRSAAIFALGRSGAGAAVPYLERIAADEEEDRLIRARADAALKEIVRDGQGEMDGPP